MVDEAATPDLVARMRHGFEAGKRGDLDAIMSSYARDATWVVVGLGARLEGAAAIRVFLEEWLGAYEEWEIVPEELVDLGNGVVFGVLVQQGRLLGSTAQVRYRFAQVSAWDDGVIVRVTGYTDIDEARAAAKRLAQERG